MRKTGMLLAAHVLGVLTTINLYGSAAGQIEKTDRGVVVETERYRVEFRDAVLASLFNKLTREEYLDGDAKLDAVLPHLPSGLGTQNGEEARAAAEKIYTWPWWEHPNDMCLPNQHYADRASDFKCHVSGVKAELTYTGLTDGRARFADETFSLALEIDAATGDLLVTPIGVSPRPGVYAANMTMVPLAPAVTIEAPICDGIQISRADTGPVLWVNQWPSFWEFGLIALNGWKTGAFGIWTQDAKMRFYKHLFYLNNSEGLSVSLSMMNVPPFEELKECRAPLPWRIQAFDKSWMQVVARFQAWREGNVKFAPQPEFAKQISFMSCQPSAHQQWLDSFLRYVSPWQNHAAAFLSTIRKQSFDRNHADNTPYDGFGDDAKRWREAGTYGMAYLQPMIMWGPFRPEDKQSDREKQALAYHKLADTRSVFLKDATTAGPGDQHHLGQPEWQRWFLGWVKEWCRQYGAQGIYHDQTYPCPIDRRGLAVGGMTSPEGMADYFYKAATENPGTFHGSEKVTEPNSVALANAIGSGYHWGTAPYMRMTRADHSSPIGAALVSPRTVLWSFVRLRGDSLWDLRERRMQEMRAQIAGGIDGPTTVDPKYFPLLCNTPWHDRTRDATFLQYGLRPYFPEDYDRQVESYFRGEKGDEFRYEKMPWGSRFVQPDGKGNRRFLYGIASGVQAVPVADAGIAGWVVYNQDDTGHTWNRTGPSGLHPDRFYVLDPRIKRPPAWFSTTQGCGPSLYESYVEDCSWNEYLLFLRLRPIERLSKIAGAENLLLHSSTPPACVYVNGTKTELKKSAGSDTYAMNVQVPSDIVVMLQAPPPGLENAHKAALTRATESGAPVDYYLAEALQPQIDGGRGTNDLPAVKDASVPHFGFNYGMRKHLYVPVAAPADSKGGVLRLHLPPRENVNLERVEVNFQALALAQDRLSIPETLEIPLAPGEIKLVSFDSHVLRDPSLCNKPSIRATLEWKEKVADAAKPQ